MGGHTAESAIRRLTEGNQRFLSDRIEGRGRDGPRRGELTKRQEPYAAILSCSDSRIAPEIAFDTGLGELFVVRVAGNVANTCSIASLEFAVQALGIKLIAVLGHENCGAVQAALAGTDGGPNLSRLLEHMAPVLASGETDPDRFARLNATHTTAMLVERSTVIREALDRGDIRIVTAFYHLQTGAISVV